LLSIGGAFDLLWLNGADLRSLPLVERKARLRRLRRELRNGDWRAIRAAPSG
jgi:ATP-dependent DNA ligase